MSILDGIGFALGLWGIFWPHPRILVIGVMLVAPILAIALVWRSDGEISLNDRRGQKRPVLGSLMLFPLLVMALLALDDFKLVDWKAPLLVGAAIGAVAVRAAARAEPEFRKVLWLLLLFPFAAAWGWGLASEANGMFDQKPQRIISAPVVRKYVSGGRSHTRYLIVGKTPVPEISGEISVSRDLYDATEVGEPACLELHRGTLGWRWYRSVACDVGAALTFDPSHAPFRAS